MRATDASMYHVHLLTSCLDVIGSLRSTRFSELATSPRGQRQRWRTMGSKDAVSARLFVELTRCLSLARARPGPGQLSTLRRRHERRATWAATYRRPSVVPPWWRPVPSIVAFWRHILHRRVVPSCHPGHRARLDGWVSPQNPPFGGRLPYRAGTCSCATARHRTLPLTFLTGQLWPSFFGRWRPPGYLRPPAERGRCVDLGVFGWVGACVDLL